MTIMKTTNFWKAPFLLPIYDIGFSKRGEIYFTMRKVEGISLGKKLRQAKKEDQSPFQDWNELINIILKLCDAHSKNVIHQDIKPDNIMLSRYPYQVDICAQALLWMNQIEEAQKTYGFLRNIQAEKKG